MSNSERSVSESRLECANANTAIATGDVRAYEKAKKNRDGWILASVIIGVIAAGIQIAVVVAES